MRIKLPKEGAYDALETALLLRPLIYTIPMRQHPSKRPMIPTWGQGPLTESEIRRYFKPGCAIAVVCGSQSAGFHVIDIECEEAKEAFERNCYNAGLSAELEKLYCVRTPSGGTHYGFRCEHSFKTTVLARGRHDMQGAKANGLVIELRGEGSCALIPPSRGYKQHQQTLTRLDYIDKEVAETLLRCCRAINADSRKADHEEWLRYPKFEAASQSRSPIRRAFDARERYEELLPVVGWQECGKSGSLTYWTRPGKDINTSAASGYGPRRDCFVNYSSSVEEFAPYTSYTKLDVYAILFAGGNQSIALRQWHEEQLSSCESSYEMASLINEWALDE